MMKRLVVLLGICLLAACVKDPVVRPTIIHNVSANTDRDTLTLRVPVPMVSFNLTYRQGDRNVLAFISPFPVLTARPGCSTMLVRVNEPDVWLHLQQTVNIRRRRTGGYEFYIPLSYAPYFSFISHTVELDTCGVVFMIESEQLRQIGRFIDAAVLMNNTLRH